MDAWKTVAHEPAKTEVVVRRLEAADVDGVVALDAKVIGRKREGYLRPKLKEAFAESAIEVSLAADVDGRLAGFLLGKVYYGEFGATEPVAVLDTLGVHPDAKGRGVAAALMDQLRTNLKALRIARLRTEVGWDVQDLLSFFHHEGFRPAARICLELDLESAAERERIERRAAH